MPELNEKELLTNINRGEFIERYVARFTQGLDTDSANIYDFDRMLLARDGDDDVPNELIWGAIRDYSKHVGLLSNTPSESEVLQEIQRYFHRLNVSAIEQTATAFSNYLQEHYTSITTITENALIEIPDPTVPHLGDYPVVDVILYAHPDDSIMKTVEATRYSANLSVDDPDAVFDHVSRAVPSRDIQQYADDVYQETVDAFSTELTSNLVEGLQRDALVAAGYTELKEEPVPDDVNRLYAGKPATYWQKEIWTIDEVDATTGFARVWFLPDDHVGVVEPSDGDFDHETAVAQIRTELDEYTTADAGNT
ncbi:hypothetical protein [Halospeciosus flavus]|uniref:Uncharacterized protein n=1 Tax=Halospeciosus flavus TaxID=3032283 RepID=A0ABD5YZC2_9EURY|nr:hypothetical protein [Halospeciosus flavus]